MLDIMCFNNGEPKRIALLSSEPIKVILTTEEKTSVQDRVNCYDRYYICYIFYDYFDQQVKLIAGLAHYSYISIFHHLKEVKNEDLTLTDIEMTLRFKEWTFESQSLSEVTTKILRNKRKLPKIVLPEYSIVKQSIIHWREQLGDKIVL